MTRVAREPQEIPGGRKRLPHSRQRAELSSGRRFLGRGHLRETPERCVVQKLNGSFDSIRVIQKNVTTFSQRLPQRKRRWRYTLLLLPLFIYFTVGCLPLAEAAPKKHNSQEKAKYSSFSDPTTGRFIHQTMNEHTGQIYVGAVNTIFQLDENLNVQSVAKMGPQEDDPWCPVTRQCPTIHRKPLDYYNKVLVIDYVNSRLISCGSLFQGVCAVHRLDNVHDTRTPAHESVVANNATASTVGFIGKGPNNQRVLYVGVSYTNNGPYRSDVPAVSSRSLDLNNNTFNIAVTGVSTGTRVSVNSLAREFFPIHYVFGFTSKDFSYWLTVQKKETDRPYPYISKLVRVCQRDVHYYSYTEVALTCKTSDGLDYNLAQAAYVGKPGSELAVSLGISAQDDVLFVVFAKSQDEGDDSHNKPTHKSALCVYALSAVHRKFTQNIHHCFNGHGQRGLDFINPSQPCQLTQVQISDDFCGMEVNTPLDGAVPIDAAPLLVYPNTLLTSVSAVSTHDYTVCFLGTADGHLKKAVVESVNSAFEYADIALDEGKPVQPDMLFDREHKYVYVMTEKKITKVNVQECSQYKTCVDCLGAQDPYCGWCSLENKCSLRSDCAQAAQDPLYWLSYKSGKCTTITQVHPPRIQRTTARILSLNIGNLPNLEGNFYCAFTTNGKTLETNATKTTNGVQCATPHTDSLPSIASGEHHFTAKLSVRMRNNPDFVATNFTFYDCSTYSSCTECVSSPFPCDWCVGGHRCTHDTGENCRNDVLVTGVASVGPSIRSGPGFCPRINATNNVPEQLVAMGVNKIIQVRVDNIPPFIAQTKFICQFNIEGRVKQVNARMLGDTIYCDQMNFSYTSLVPNITATFAVIWDSSKPLDNPDNMHVLVYRCNAMSENCGMCLELPDKYGCGWCQDSNKCEVQDQCHKHTVKWLERTQTCPDPQITKVTPMSGPLEGGTNITIDGYNLGRVFADIENGLFIDLGEREKIECKAHPELYVKTTRIVCELRGPAGNKTASGNTISGSVVVKVANDYMARSPDPYSFVNPRITSINPSKGPMSGGTKLRIWGLHMDAGSHAEAFVGSRPCEIISRKPNVVECITSDSQKAEEGKVRLKLDRGLKSFEEYGFLYVGDPEVHQVDSGGAPGSTGHVKGSAPKGIPSGGISVLVRGTHLNSVQEPMMYVALDGVEYYSKCTPESSSEMKCRTPSVPSDQLSFAEDEDFIELEYGFKMDNVKGVRHLSSTKGFPKFQMYPDPSYAQFAEEGGIKYYKSDYLTINGGNLDRASQETDVVVRIGAGFCNVTSLSRTQLTCRPPTEQPAALDESGQIDRNRIPQVIVEVGDNLRYQIGMLSYDAPHGHENQLSRPIVIGVICGGVILIIIVIGILIAYRRKSTESSRVLKTMQEQMDVLELRVASECKEAFAELQTEMTDLTSDLTAGGIPYLDYRTYTMKVLFPNMEDHAVLKEMQVDPVKKQYMEKGLRMFGQLIMNRTFLLLFIRTLESNRYFSMRDRVQVASLIMVTLQGKMEYCTDILKTLLAELIEKCIDGKSHPKLLLRRTESVAEKMLSAWFTFLLYKFLRECAGEPLFVLFRAIKQQVDKGPVDAVTSEARYSLSEEKLIRQSVDYKSITAYFSIAPQSFYMQTGMMDSTDGQDISVRVLDCDTISQVKDKGLDAIYKNTPASQRPNKEELDLEWRTGTSGRITLSDEDATTKTEGEWRRYNTLAHYKVPDGASLILVPKQSSTYNLSITSEKMTPAEKTLYHKYETLNFTAGFNRSPPMSRATSPPLHGLGDLEGGFKYWHLVRHADADRDERGNKMVSEIYLTRLLATKGTLQNFVDDLFETIFSTAHRGSALPLAIKYMFDFLDDQALQHNIQDPEVVHTWKSNSLPLRFWVNLIKNPNFVFDTNKSNIVDSCLSVVAQTFMDACSTSDHRLGKDSPSSKLLYAKDIPNYKDLVERYYANIRMMPQISEEHMNAMLAEESRQHAHEFNTNVALHELYKFAARYTEQLIQTLEEDEFAQKNRLAYKLSMVAQTMRGETDA
ncbi:plexin-A4 [Galendromus occidentalis]|uniref:Plexin-A4 n=1 Tax=Galendromus occidentalis TaxID=34638 RepID=A0AAJ6QLY9_9ACAR|nr:plexin-A4 [Galendromus occidentalis]